MGSEGEEKEIHSVQIRLRIKRGQNVLHRFSKITELNSPCADLFCVFYYLCQFPHQHLLPLQRKHLPPHLYLQQPSLLVDLTATPTSTPTPFRFVIFIVKRQNLSTACSFFW